MAWIGFAEHDPEKTVRPVAEAGFAKDYFAHARIVWADAPGGRGPTGLAIRTGRPFVARNSPDDPSYEVWRAATVQPDCKASIAIPLIIDGEVLGSFSVFAAEVDAFGPSEERVLVELAGDLAFGLGVVFRRRGEAEQYAAALRLSEHKLNMAQAILHVGYWEYEPSSDRLTWSEETFRILGLKPGSRTPTLAQFEEMVHPEDRARQVEAVALAKEGQASYDVEYRVVRPDGEIRAVHDRGCPAPQGLGQPNRIFGAIQDITELARARDALHRSEELYRELVHYAPWAIYVHVAGRVTFTNPAMCRLLGAERPDQIVGRTVMEIVHPDYHARVMDRWRQLEAGQPAPPMEQKFVRLDGTVVDVEVSAVAVEYALHREIHVIAHDITERKQAEKELRESEERFRQLAENIREVFWMSDPAKGTILYVSPAYETIWGRSCESLYATPRDWLDAVFAEDRPRVREAYATKQSRGVYNETYRIVRPDGTIRWIHDRAFPVRDKEGVVYRIVGTAEDITEAKVMEEQFLRAQRIENLGMLAAGIAHDFNNLLAPLLMGVPLLRSNATTTSDLRVLAAMENSAQRGAALVQQILSFAHGSGGERALIQVKHLVRETGDLIRETFPKSIRLESEVPSALWPIQGNLSQIHQVLLNLCVNARDAMPQGGTLRLRAQNMRFNEEEALAIADAHPGAYVMLEVADTGTGIPPDILAHIWDPFFTTKGEGKGTGLGLATVRGISANHGGFVTVASEVGRGTTFRIFLPAVEEPTAGVPASISQHPFLPRGDGELVLVVDDEASVREPLKALLNENGYVALVARDGIEAIATFARHAADIALVITDLDMPEIGGEQLVQTLAHFNTGVKVLFMSGLDSPRVTKTTPGKGHFLKKPFTAETLLGAVNLALHGKSPAT